MIVPLLLMFHLLYSFTNKIVYQLINLIFSTEYLMYLKQLPDIKEKLESLSLITLHSADAIPPKKRPRCALNEITI